MNDKSTGQPGGPTSLTNTMARWCIDGWQGRAPLRPVFWVGGAIWFFGYGLERGMVYLFLLPQSPYYVSVSPTLSTLLRASEWILLGVFIWWCVAVWRCAAAETPGVWPTTARGIVALLVLGNAVTALVAMSQ